MRHAQTAYELLGEVLHLVAAASEPYDSIGPILKCLQPWFSATGCYFILHDSPHRPVKMGSIPDPELLDRALISMAEGFHLDALKNTGDDRASIALSVGSDEQSVAGLALFYEQAAEFDDASRYLLSSLVDVFKIVTLQIRSDDRHEKVGRNHSEFMRVVSHDLRSPLTSMQGFASMLESGMVGELNEKQEHFVEKILSGITQMTSLVDNIQDAGRFDPETGFYEMERSHCDLGDIVLRIINNHLIPAEKQTLTLEAKISDDVPILNADFNMLERAIANLVDNAIKYTPNGCTVRVGVKREDDQVVISVKDNGLGISPENQKMLFERHVRIRRREHSRVKGSGLGLFIVRSVARRHGGDAWIHSEEGEGSTFFIGIPLKDENLVIFSEQA